MKSKILSRPVCLIDVAQLHPARLSRSPRSLNRLTFAFRAARFPLNCSQNGTSKQDTIFGVASREDGRVIFAGVTQGSFGRLRGDAQREAIAVMLQEGDYVYSRPPTFAPTPSSSSLLATASPSVSSTMHSDGPTMMSSSAPTSDYSPSPSLSTSSPSSMVMTSPTPAPDAATQPTASTESTPSPQGVNAQDESGGGSSGTDGAIIGGAVAAAVVVVAAGAYAGYRMRSRAST